jgi:glycosyltransferase involved in cell wall biosynthesis
MLLKYRLWRDPPTRKYVLVTPARNEEASLARTIDSVLAQRVKPARWVIVSDGSTDRTETIARQHAAGNDFIAVLRREGGPAAGFDSKVRAFQAGWQLLRPLEFDFIGNLDADVTFGPDYFERLIDEFVKNPRLGVGSGWVCEKRRGAFRPRMGNTTRDASGAVEVFRRRCFEEIGGFPELFYGGEDAAAQATARMHGWEVASFPHLRVQHHKTPGSKLALNCRLQFREGLRDYALGYHPVYLAGKCVRRATARPWLLGSAFRFLGFLWASVRRVKPGLDPKAVAFIRREQMERVRELWGQT